MSDLNLPNSLAEGSTPAPTAPLAAQRSSAGLSDAARFDYTAFYRETEAVAVEVRRLLDSGALAGVVRALRAIGARLELEVYAPGLEQSEYLGQVEPGSGDGEERYDYEAFMANREEQWVTFADGKRERVVMPDHICPSCGRDEDNFIVEVRKTCAVCHFEW